MPRKKGPALTREDVIAAAIRSLEAEGVEGFGINRVARELGIKPPSLYNHVASNEDLRLAVVLLGWSRLGDDFEAASRSQEETAGKLARLADAYRGFALANPALYTLMAATPLDSADPAAGAVAQRVMEVFYRMLTPLGITGDDAIHAIRSLRAALHGFVLLELSGQFGMRQSVDESYAWMIEALSRIVAPRPQQEGVGARS